MSATPTPPPPRTRLDAAVRRARTIQPRIASRAREAGRWTHQRWDNLRRGKIKRPSNKVLAWTGGILAGLVAALALFLTWFDWDRMRGPIERFASARIHRTVDIDGHLRVKLLTWTPTVRVEGLRIGQPAWAPKGDMVSVKSATVSLRLKSLLKRDVVLPLVLLDGPKVDLRRSLDGKANWRFSDKPSTKAAKLPPINHFIINDGVLRYQDPKARLFVDGIIEAREQRSAAYTAGFKLSGDGTINGNPFVLRVTGGPMINIDPDRPYPFNADVRGGATRIRGQGSITRPFDFGSVRANMTVEGSDMNDLYALTRLTLPNTPPYKLSGLLVRDQSQFSFTGINGRVGDSDLHGRMLVETKGRLNLQADLQSNRLQLDDLMAVLGGAPSPKGTISPEQAQIARTMRAERRILPNATLQIDRLRRMDATLKYRALSVRSPTLPVRAATLDLKLKEGVLDLDPFRFTLVSGEVLGKARIDGRKATPVTDLDVRLRGANIQQFIRVKGPPPVEGVILARAKLRGAGSSVRAAAANADGAITVVAPRGRIRQAFAELLGVNAGRGLYLLLNNDPRETELRCVVADFKVANGVARADNIVIDTGVVLAKGSGVVNLDTERVDLVVEGASKKPRLLRLWMPITLKGPLSAPKPGVRAEKVVAQTGIGLALGSLLSPLAAILPFVDPGLAKDADCAGLLASAAASPAPVKAGAVRASAH